MSENKSPLCIETVVKGQKPHWPYDSLYREPTREGYRFVGWKCRDRVYTPEELQNEQENPFDNVYSNVNIYGVWEEIQ